MKKIIFITLAITFLLSSCTDDNKDNKSKSTKSQKKTEASTIHLGGQMSNASNKMVYLSLYEGGRQVDSVMTDSEGNFTMEVPVKQTDFYKFYLDQKNAIILILNENNKEVKIGGDANNFTNTYTVEGSKDSDLMRQFFLAQKEFKTKSDGVLKVIRTADPENRKVAQVEYNNLVSEYNKRMKDWALKNASSPVALSMMSTLNPKDNIEVYDKVFAQLDKVIPHSKLYTNLKKSVEKLKQVDNQGQASGNITSGPAPEIAMNNPNGKTRKLSSLKGKYVLIDFWASWCAPCRRENPNVVKMYEKYKDKGFEIFGVSLDKDRKRWQAAIEADGLTWTQVSDLAGWGSAAAKKYGVTSIPHTVLLDKEGNIIATKLRGPSLEAKLKELMGS